MVRVCGDTEAVVWCEGGRRGGDAAAGAGLDVAPAASQVPLDDAEVGEGAGLGCRSVLVISIRAAWRGI